MYGVQSYHLLLCDALGLDSSWYGVPSAIKKRKGLSDPLNVGTRANGPTLTLALASIEMRHRVSAVSATPLTIVTWSKIASVSGSFGG